MPRSGGTLALTLTLFVPRVGTNHPHNTFATNDFAIPADFLNGCSYFHVMTPAAD
jgi:hypothetical protein